MLEKKENNKYYNNYEKGFVDGYNSCIDEIINLEGRNMPREKLKKACKEAGMTQQAVADFLSKRNVKFMILYDGEVIVCSNGTIYKRYRNGFYNNFKCKPSTLDGYLRISIKVGGKIKLFLIHRLIAKAFIPNPNNYPVVNHIDSNKSNNSVRNLEWCSHKYNIQHMVNSHKQKYLTNLKKQRIDNGISSNKIARKIGLMLGAYRDIENAVRPPTKEEKVTIEKYFGQCIEKLLDKAE